VWASDPDFEGSSPVYTFLTSELQTYSTTLSSTENPYNLGRKFKITYTIVHNYTAPLFFKT
jgi:hypothetical protein